MLSSSGLEIYDAEQDMFWLYIVSDVFHTWEEKCWHGLQLVLQMMSEEMIGHLLLLCTSSDLTTAKAFDMFTLSDIFSHSFVKVETSACPYVKAELTRYNANTIWDVSVGECYINAVIKRCIDYYCKFYNYCIPFYTYVGKTGKTIRALMLQRAPPQCLWNKESHLFSMVVLCSFHILSHY